MRNKKAKSYRKQAYEIGSKVFGKKESIKIIKGKQHIWEKNSPKAIYKRFKKAHFDENLIIAE